MRPNELALRYVGLNETASANFIAAWISDARGEQPEPPESLVWKDDGGEAKAARLEAWCGAYAYHVAHRLLGLEAPRQPLRARAWLGVGMPVKWHGEREWPGGFAGHRDSALASEPGDVVILSRGPLPQPGPEVEMARGHLGFLLSDQTDNRGIRTHRDSEILLVSGNVSDAVTVSSFPIARVLGVRRLRPA